MPRAARPPERCGKAHHAQVVAAIPAGLTTEQWNSVPNAKDLCDTIGKIDGAKLAADIRKSLSSADLAALQGLIGTYRNVDETAVRTALAAWNAANLRVMSQFVPDRLIAPIQLHHACRGTPVIGRMGTFPTGDGMDGAVDRKSLTADNNPTVLVTRMLDADQDAVWGNLLPTTLKGDYTLVPSEAVFEAFARAADDAVRALIDAGLLVFHCISPKNGVALRRVLHGGDPNPRIVVLLVSNGTIIELHVPPTGKAVLVVLPFEHASHVLWHSMKAGTRLWLLKGLLDAHAAAASLLGRLPPRTAELLAAVLAVKFVKWYRGGAYMEAVMKARLAVFIAVFGVDDGTARWRAWYTGCKRRAGASGAPAARGHTRAHCAQPHARPHPAPHARGAHTCRAPFCARLGSRGVAPSVVYYSMRFVCAVPTPSLTSVAYATKGTLAVHAQSSACGAPWPQVSQWPAGGRCCLRAIAMPHPSSLAGDGKDGFVVKRGGDKRVFGEGLTRAAALVEVAAVAGGGQPVELVSVARRKNGKLSPAPRCTGAHTRTLA